MPRSISSSSTTTSALILCVSISANAEAASELVTMVFAFFVITSFILDSLKSIPESSARRKSPSVKIPKNSLFLLVIVVTPRPLADISINAFGFGQKIGDTGVMALSIMSLDFGEIERTTYENPDGGIGTFSPQFMNISLSYAKKFTYNMSAGITVKMISESAAELSANGFALDAGVHYETGDKGQAKFGITLKNIGPRMAFNGDGDDVTVTGENGYDMTMEIRSASFELPSLLNIGGSYDFYWYSDMWRFTISETFVSNSFSKDQFLTGLEIAFKEMISLRGGYGYETGIFDDFDNGRTTAFKGVSAGFSIELPISDDTNFGLDYSYRPADPLQSVHTFGARVIF